MYWLIHTYLHIHTYLYIHTYNIYVCFPLNEYLTLVHV